MDLRHLRQFVAVAEEGHITRAAEKLGMQQPPLSQQIKAMERELDVVLFHRKPRGVELTDAGRVLFVEARAVLAHLERALETTHRTARGEQGQLCIGIAPTALFHPLVPRAIRDFREAFPLVSLTLEEPSLPPLPSLGAPGGPPPSPHTDLWAAASLIRDAWFLAPHQSGLGPPPSGEVNDFSRNPPEPGIRVQCGRLWLSRRDQVPATKCRSAALAMFLPP